MEVVGEWAQSRAWCVECLGAGHGVVRALQSVQFHLRWLRGALRNCAVRDHGGDLGSCSMSLYSNLQYNLVQNGAHGAFQLLSAPRVLVTPHIVHARASLCHDSRHALHRLCVQNCVRLFG